MNSGRVKHDAQSRSSEQIGRATPSGVGVSVSPAFRSVSVSSVSRVSVQHFHYTDYLLNDVRETLGDIFDVPATKISVLQLRQDDFRPDHATLLTFE